MTTLLHNSPLFQDVNPICLYDGVKSVRNSNRSAAFFRLFQSIADQALRLRIKRRRGFVQQEDARLSDQRSGQNNSLFLTDAELCAFVSDHGFEAISTVDQQEREGFRWRKTCGKFLINSYMLASLHAFSTAVSEDLISPSSSPAKRFILIVPLYSVGS